jgi:hypothetical protein
MGLEKDIYNRIVNTLKEDTVLQGMVKTYIEGSQATIQKREQLPAIVIDLEAIEDFVSTFPKRKRSRLRFLITGITREASIQELLELDEAIKNALDKDIQFNLGEKILSSSLQSRELQAFEFGRETSRATIIALEVETQDFIGGQR